MPDWQEAFPNVHRALAPPLRTLPAHEVESILQEAFGEGVGLADAEGFFDDIGHALSSAAKVVAPIAQKALPGIVSGAISGLPGGPLGMLAGAGVGAAGSLLGGGGRPAGAPAPGAPPGPTAAVTQLLGMLGSPAVPHALSAMMLGGAGARTVPGTGGTELPVSAITNLLGMLAGRASAEWEVAAHGEAIEGFAEGVDIGSPEARAGWVLEHLPPPAFEAESTDEAWVDEMFDAFDTELAALDEADAWSLD
jgi:hypothetical protein